MDKKTRNGVHEKDSILFGIKLEPFASQELSEENKSDLEENKNKMKSIQIGNFSVGGKPIFSRKCRC
jgi:hypothetical protein